MYIHTRGEHVIFLLKHTAQSLLRRSSVPADQPHPPSKINPTRKLLEDDKQCITAQLDTPKAPSGGRRKTGSGITLKDLEGMGGVREGRGDCSFRRKIEQISLYIYRLRTEAQVPQGLSFKSSAGLRRSSLRTLGRTRGPSHESAK